MSFVMFIAAVLTVYYLSKVLLLEEKTSHYGPFPSETDLVVWTQTASSTAYHEYTQPVTLFDRVRRIFGLYHIDRHDDKSETWFVNSKRVEMWTCPVCLSFWVSLPVTLMFVVDLRLPFVYLALLPFALSGGSTLLHKFLGNMENTGTHIYIGGEEPEEDD